MLISNFSELPKLEINKFIPKNTQGIVIVDKREFNSEIPYLLYKNDFHVHPKFLLKGDYILSDYLAIERKDCTTGDMFNSINTGRLDN